MSVTRGALGIAKGKLTSASGSASQIREVRNWQFTESAEDLDASEIGTGTRESVAGVIQTTGTLECHWSPGGSDNQDFMTVGAIVDLELYPGGSGSGNTYYKTPAAGATLLSIDRSGGLDGTVGSTFGFTVNGQFTATSVP